MRTPSRGQLMRQRTVWRFYLRWAVISTAKALHLEFPLQMHFRRPATGANNPRGIWTVAGSGCGALDSLGRDEDCKPLAGVEHAGLHGVLRDAENLDDLADRLLLVVDQIDDLGVLARKGRERAADGGARMLPAELRLGVARRIGRVLRSLAIERLGRPAARGIQCLVSRDPEQPAGHRRAASVLAGMLPGLEEGLAHRILGERGIAHDAHDEAKHLQLVPFEQSAHGGLVAARDLPD